MNRIIQLFKERNHYLDKFIDLNTCELQKFNSGNFEDVEVFYETRDRLLNLLKCLEDLIELEYETIKNKAIEVNGALKQDIRYLLGQKEEKIQLIVEQDIELISLVDQEKTKIYHTMKTIKKGRKVISAYKSKNEGTVP